MQKSINEGSIKTKRSTLKKYSTLTVEETIGVLAEIIANNIINKILTYESRKNEFDGSTTANGKAAEED